MRGSAILADGDDVPAPLVQRVANLRCMATEGTSFRCAALLGTVGCAVGCGIYGRRLEVCRSFDTGSDECLAARDAMRAKLAELRRAVSAGGAPGLIRLLRPQPRHEVEGPQEQQHRAPGPPQPIP